MSDFALPVDQGRRVRVTYEGRCVDPAGRYVQQDGDGYRIWVPLNATVEVLPEPLAVGDQIDDDYPEPPVGTVLLDNFTQVWVGRADGWVYAGTDNYTPYAWDVLVLKNVPLTVVYVPDGAS